jgi:hypothetical protein
MGSFIPALVTAMITASDGFDAAGVPGAPDYTGNAASLALPSTAEEADVALPELPAIEAAAAGVEVFYLHPTSSIERRWNAPVGDAAVRAASIRGGTFIQASVFNGCCAVYAPSYRQASGIAFVKPSHAGDQAIDFAFADVSAAFSDFQRRRGSARPFILAGHSQGAVLAARLLREQIANGDEWRASSRPT